jgi:hypothetical protein
MTIIAFKTNDGVGFVCPSQDALDKGWPLEAIANKDCPAGSQYVFVDNENEVIDWTKANTALGESLFWSIELSAQKAKEETLEQTAALNVKNQPTEE